MPVHRNATRARQALAAGLIRTRQTLVVCVACGHERVYTPRREPSCPEGGASARRSFTLSRSLREDR